MTEPGPQAAPAARGRTLSEDVFGATLLNTLLLPVRVLVSLFTSVVVYQVLSRAEVGVILLLQSLANTLGLYVDLGIERTLARFLPEVDVKSGREGVKRLLRRVLQVKVLILLPVIVSLLALATPLARALAEKQRTAAAQGEEAVAAATGAAAFALHEKAAADRALAGEIEDRRYLFLGAVAVLVAIGALHDVFMQSLNAFFRRREWNTITIFGNLLQPLLVATFVLLGYGIPGVLLGYVIVPACTLLLSGRAVRRVVRALPLGEGGAVLPSGLRPRFTRYAALDYFFQLTGWLYDLPFLVLLAAHRLTLEQVALLGFAYKFAKDFLTYVYWPLIGVVTPVLARVRSRESETAMKDAYASLVRLIGLVVIPAGAGLCLLSPRLIAALYPKLAEAWPYAVVFVAFVFVDMILGVAQTALMTLERYRPVLLLRLSALLSLPVAAFLLPSFGLLGAAWGFGLVRVLPPLLVTLYAAARVGLGFPLRFLFRVALASAAFAVPLALLLGPAPLVTAATRPNLLAVLPLLGYAGLGAVVFLIALKATGGLDPDDRRRLLELRLPFKARLAHLL